MAKKCGPIQQIIIMRFSIVVVTIAVLLIISEMYFAYIGWKSPSPLYSDCKPIAEERPSNVNVIQSIQRWTVHLVGYTILSLTIRVCLQSFSRCCLPNLQNHAKFRAVRGRSRSSTLFKVIELDRLDANRKSIICNFLLIINSDCGVTILILYLFLDIDA